MGSTCFHAPEVAGSIPAAPNRELPANWARDRRVGPDSSASSAVLDTPDTAVYVPDVQATSRWRLVPAVGAVVLGLAVAGVFASAVEAHSLSKWYWTPGACKSELKNFGVKLGDGRTFNVANAFCVGYHNHCWLSGGVHRYKVFATVVRSYDGIVRLFQLTVTGKDTWSGTPPRIVQHSMSEAQFNAKYGPTAWAVASSENQAGCWDVHP